MNPHTGCGLALVGPHGATSLAACAAGPTLRCQPNAVRRRAQCGRSSGALAGAVKSGGQGVAAAALSVGGGKPAMPACTSAEPSPPPNAAAAAAAATSRCSRRQLLLPAATSAALLAAAQWKDLPGGVCPAHAGTSADAGTSGSASGSASGSVSGGGGSFYADWPYVVPGDILPYLQEAATPGDIDSVLAAIDVFASYYPMYRCGPEKGAILERLVAQQQPALALELGTFMGYGTARIARQLPPGGRVVSIEANAEQAAVARAVLEFAGLPVGEGPEARVQVVNGLSGDVLPRLRELAGVAPGAAAGLVFLDHCKKCYLPDLRAMEALALVAPGSLVVADNVVVPGAPGFLEYLASPAAAAAAESGNDGAGRRGGRGDGGGASGGGGTGAPGLAYRTELLESMFEVEEQYKRDWVPQRDAMSVSLCLAAPAAPGPA